MCSRRIKVDNRSCTGGAGEGFILVLTQKFTVSFCSQLQVVLTMVLKGQLFKVHRLVVLKSEYHVLLTEKLQDFYSSSCVSRRMSFTYELPTPLKAILGSAQTRSLLRTNSTGNLNGCNSSCTKNLSGREILDMFLLTLVMPAFIKNYFESKGLQTRYPYFCTFSISEDLLFRKAVCQVMNRS